MHSHRSLVHIPLRLTLLLVLVGMSLVRASEVPIERPRVGSPANVVALRSVSAQLDEIVTDLSVMAKRAPWKQRGYFDAPENDAIGVLFFQFTTARDALLGLGANISLAGDPDSAANTLVTYAAALALLDVDGRVVETFIADSVATAKLNEAFYRWEIPAGTFSKLQEESTNRERIETVTKGLATYEAELADPNGPLGGALARDPALGSLVASADARRDAINARLERLTKHQARILGSAENRVSHSRLSDGVRVARRDLGAALTRGRALLFKNVSRIKSPRAHLIRFSDAQKAEIRAALEPGDLLFSYTAGYISDVFIPGAFKHALVWVGSPQSRREAGLTPSALADLPGDEARDVEAHIGQAVVEEGGSADIIEAVAEGVKFSHLDTILDTHINRLLVLRPQIDDADRVAALVEVFRFLGDGYDFRFDFANASKQVCTELVYRAYDGRGPIRYALTPRAGHPTLSADDIIIAAMGPAAEAYEVILFADEDPDGKGHAARVLEGQAAGRAVVELLDASSPKADT